jgi:putative aldouronate transport system permease protein
MYGIIIAFKKFQFNKGFLGSPWVGLWQFERFVLGPFFARLLSSTFLISLYSLLWGFPIPILFALMLNELKQLRFKRVVQTISYLPHFLSLVIVVGLLKQLVSSGGVINQLIRSLGGRPINFFMEASWFRTLYVGSGVWQEFGWGAIIYLAALSAIDPELYDAARIDGAGRMRCLWHITLTGLRPTIVILLILSMGNILSVGAEKILLMYSPATYETSDVISTYVYRVGLVKMDYSYGTAVGLMNSIVSFLLVISANFIGKKVSGVGIW